MSKAEYNSVCLMFQLLRRPRQDSLCPRVQGQLGQHSETLSQQISKFTKYCNYSMRDRKTTTKAGILLLLLPFINFYHSPQARAIFPNLHLC